MFCGMAGLIEAENGVVTVQSYRTARARLESHKRKTYDDASTRLRILRSKIQIFQTIDEVGLRNDERLQSLDFSGDTENFIYEVFSVIDSHFPIDSEWMAEEFSNNDEVYLLPKAMGINRFSDDEILDVFLEPESNFESDESLIVFAAMLNGAIGGEEWDACNDYFGWNIPINPMETSRGMSINWETLDEQLSQNGMDHFRGAVEMACYGGNTFFSFNAFDGYSEYPEFTKQNFDRLKEEWREASLTIDSANEARSLCEKDNSLYLKFAFVWTSCLEKPEKVRVRV
ncbi:hypothetical protein hrd7_25110 [Leptolinea sp. HRD-7]|nr:hypothetical protein hrd7_25110 [Leptolinea sp. HRD-7]